MPQILKEPRSLYQSPPGPEAASRPKGEVDSDPRCRSRDHASARSDVAAPSQAGCPSAQVAALAAEGHSAQFLAQTRGHKNQSQSGAYKPVRESGPRTHSRWIASWHSGLWPPRKEESTRKNVISFFHASTRSRRSRLREEVYARCAGLDVHKNSVPACVRIRKNRTCVEVESAQFTTMTADQENLRQWLRERKVRKVFMESTSVYWVPVWNVWKRAEWKFDLVLANPAQVKADPGRKTDQQDCERLAGLGQARKNFRKIA